MNASEVIRQESPKLKGKVVGNKASRMLSSDGFQKSLTEIMEEKGITNEKLSQYQERNIKQSVNLSASNQAIELAHKLKGNLTEKKITIKANIDLNNEHDLNKRIKELTLELKA